MIMHLIYCPLSKIKLIIKVDFKLKTKAQLSDELLKKNPDDVDGKRLRLGLCIH